MKKVYFCVNNLREGGLTNVICNIVIELNKNQQKFEYFILSANNNIPKSIPKELHEHIMVDEKINYNKRRFLSIIPTFNLFRKNKDSLFIYFMYMDTLVPLFINLFLFKKSNIIVRMSGNPSNVMSEINQLPLSFLNRNLFKIQSYFQIFLLRTVKTFIVLCLRTTDDFKFNMKNKNVYLIENPVSEDFLKTEVKTSEIQENSISIFARIEKYKGVDDILKLVDFMENKNVIINVYGEGSYFNDFQEKIIESNNENMIFLKGHVDCVKEHILRSSIVLSVSYGEGMPNNLLEAFALGRPVVAYDCFTGPREIIDSNNGFLVELGNIEDLANKCDLALNKKWDYNLIKKQTEIRFNGEKITNQYLDMIFSEID